MYSRKCHWESILFVRMAFQRTWFPKFSFFSESLGKQLLPGCILPRAAGIMGADCTLRQSRLETFATWRSCATHETTLPVSNSFSIEFFLASFLFDRSKIEDKDTAALNIKIGQPSKHTNEYNSFIVKKRTYSYTLA